MPDQIFAGDLLEQVALGAHPHGLEQVLLVVVRAEQDDFRRRVALDKLAAQVKAARPLQSHVTQNDVGIQRRGQLLRLVGVQRLADHADPAKEPAENGRESLQHHLVVINEHDT